MIKFSSYFTVHTWDDTEQQSKERKKIHEIQAYHNDNYKIIIKTWKLDWNKWVFCCFFYCVEDAMNESHHSLLVTGN